MKVLLINSHTAFLSELVSALENLSSIVEVVDFERITPGIEKDFDLVVLSGGHGISYTKDHDAYDKETSLILNSTKPIIGICFGFKMIAQAYKSHVEKLPEKEIATIDLHITKDDPIFEPNRNYKVYVTHYWSAKELGPELEELADSPNGIQVLRHKTRPIYGFQFHPEVTNPQNDGLELMKKAISQLIPNIV